MIISELMGILEDMPEGAHVVIAVTTLPTRKCKMEIREVWGDQYGVINILMGPDAGMLHPAIYTENEIEEVTEDAATSSEPKQG